MGSSDVDFFIHSYYEFKLFGTTLSINTTMVTTVIVCLILLALILFARHEIMKNYDEPNVVQNVVEMIVEKMDALLSEVQTLQQILLENADLLSLLNHPEVSKIEKLDLLKNIFSGRASDEILGFLNIIVEKDRQKDIPKIFEYFVDKAKEYKGIGKVKVVSATELSARQKEKLTKRLLETTKYTSFEVDYQVDPSVLGGLIIRIEDRVLDSSLKTQIEKLSKGLSKLSVEKEGVVGLG